MAASYTWPPSLPQDVMRDFSENSGVLILRTPMDAGPSKMRRRGARPDQMTVGFYMTTAQVETLDNFVKNTIKGTARFYFPHPRTGAAVEARLVPGQDGQLYTASFFAPGQFTVGMTLEILP